MTKPSCLSRRLSKKYAIYQEFHVSGFLDYFFEQAVSLFFK